MKRRLADDEVKALYRAKVGGARHTDHLQARDDRKLLVSLLGRSVAWLSPGWSRAEREQWEEIRREVEP